MKRCLLFLLLLCLPCLAGTDVTCYLGGDSSSATNGGWAYSSVAAATVCGTGGAAKYTVADGTIDQDTTVRITKTGEFATGLEGVWAYVNFTGDAADGRYRITGSTANSITISLAWNALYADDAATNVYVGGALVTADATLQAALDSPPTDGAVAASGALNQTYLIYDHDTPATTIVTATGFDVDADAPDAGYYKRIKGCNSSYAVLPIGSYCVFDAAGTDLGAAIWRTGGTIGNVQFHNIKVQNNDSNGGTPGSTELGFYVNPASATRGFLLRNCWADNCYSGFSVGASALLVAFDLCIVTQVASDNIGSCYSGSSVAVAKNCYATVSDTEIAFDNLLSISHCIANGGTTGFSGQSGINYTVRNCSFYGQSTAAIDLNSATGSVFVENCIMDVDTPASDYAIRIQAGRCIEYNNLTDAAAATYSGFQDGSGSTAGETFSDTYPWVTASGGDFRLNMDDADVIAHCLDKGTLTIMGSDMDSANIGFSSLGAWQPTGTQSAGSATVNTGFNGGFDQ